MLGSSFSRIFHLKREGRLYSNCLLSAQNRTVAKIRFSAIFTHYTWPSNPPPPFFFKGEALRTRLVLFVSLIGSLLTTACFSHSQCIHPDRKRISLQNSQVELWRTWKVKNLARWEPMDYQASGLELYLYSARSAFAKVKQRSYRASDSST